MNSNVNPDYAQINDYAFITNPESSKQNTPSENALKIKTCRPTGKHAACPTPPGATQSPSPAPAARAAGSALHAHRGDQNHLICKRLRDNQDLRRPAPLRPTPLPARDHVDDSTEINLCKSSEKQDHQIGRIRVSPSPPRAAHSSPLTPPARAGDIALHRDTRRSAHGDALHSLRDPITDSDGACRPTPPGMYTVPVQVILKQSNDIAHQVSNDSCQQSHSLRDGEGRASPYEIGDAQHSSQEPYQHPDLLVSPSQFSVYIKELWPNPTEEAYGAAPLHMQLYFDVKETGLPNYMGVRREVPSSLLTDNWEKALVGYHDAEIVQYLRYGWPVSYTAPSIPKSGSVNHPSAIRHPEAVDNFLRKELSKDAMLGPFEQSPFDEWCQTSPLMTRDKKDQDGRVNGKRIIIDLSYPMGNSVNSGIVKGNFQGHTRSYTLPTPLDLASLIVKFGTGCYLWKSDLERAYRQLRVDPLDYPLLGIQHKNRTYIDICPSFGCRSSGAAQQRVSNALVYLMGKSDINMLAYVDDFAGVARTCTQAAAHLADFEKTCEHLGLQLAADKTAFPSTNMEFLGFTFDTVEMTIIIPQQKLIDVIQEAGSWMSKTHATKAQYQSLAGRLNHISQVIAPARKFISRLLAALRNAPDTGPSLIPPEVKKDIMWFVEFAESCNTKRIIPVSLPDFIIECDACIYGAGAFSHTQYYTFEFPPTDTTKYHIAQLEAINAVMAAKTLIPPDLTAHRVRIHTDNIASMYALNSGKTRDPVLAACARELWMVAAHQQLDIILEHHPGASLVLADALSRQSKSNYHREHAAHLVSQYNLARVEPVHLTCVLSDKL